MIKTKFQFYPYQKKWILDESQFKIYLKSRSVGISEASAYMAVRNCLKKNKDIAIIAKNSKDLAKMMKSCRNYASALGHLQKKKTGKDIKLNDATGSVEFVETGKRIIGFSAHNPMSIRSFYGDLIWDEATFARDGRALYDAMLPITARGHSLSIISTPMGVNDLFYEIWSNTTEFSDWSRHKIDIYQAMKDGYHIPKKIFDAIVNNAGGKESETFRREFLCEFIDESTAYFSWELIKSCHDDSKKPDVTEYYIGVDIGRTRSLTVIVVIAKINDSYSIHEIIPLKATDFRAQEEWISNAYEKYRPKYMKIDQGYNPQTTEDLCKRFYGAEGVSLGGSTKAKMTNNVKNLMEKSLLKFNLDNPEVEALTKDMHSLRMKSNSNGITFESPMNDRGHGDRYWALALALMGIENKREFLYRFA